MPTASVTLRASICGCAAAARTGRISSQSCGSPVVPPPSGIDRHIFTHCSRAARSSEGSLRSRFSSAATCSLTARSINGRASLAMLILMPATCALLSETATCAARLGCSRQFAVTDGFERTVTWARNSTLWSSTLPAMPPTALPRSLPSAPSIRPAMPPTAPPVRLPACDASWPVIFSEPLSWVSTVISPARPFTAMLPRVMVMPMSALDRMLLTGLPPLPLMVRGAEASRLRWMAESDTATGAIT